MFMFLLFSYTSFKIVFSYNLLLVKELKLTKDILILLLFEENLAENLTSPNDGK